MSTSTRCRRQLLSEQFHGDKDGFPSGTRSPG
jgi:hypothetical protein